MASKPQSIRPLSPIELYSSSRHHHGLYNRVVVTCRYTPLLPQSTLLSALKAVVFKHPMLQVCILNGGTGNASFGHIEKTDVRDHVEFITLSGHDDEKNYDAALNKIHENIHDSKFDNLDAQSPWRITVVTPGHSYQDVVFSYCHALSDGTGGKIFHQDLLSSIQTVSASASPSSADYTLHFPTPSTLPEPHEAIIASTSSWSFVISTLWKHLGPAMLNPAKPDIWAGEPIDFGRKRKACIESLDIPAEITDMLVNKCRSHGTTVTATLHALVLVSLAKRLGPEEAREFIANTPINLRPWMSSSANPALKESLRTLVTTTSHVFPPALVASLRTPATNSMNDMIWDIAKRIKDEICQRVDTLPADDIISLLKFVSNWDEYWSSKNGQTRDGSWELSNIGVISSVSSSSSAQPDGTESLEQDCKITRVFFTNSVMVAGQPFSIGAATVKGGVMALGFSWQEGVVRRDVINGVMEDLRRLIDSL